VEHVVPSVWQPVWDVQAPHDVVDVSPAKENVPVAQGVTVPSAVT
jgi:hypothetical protein